MAHARLPVIFRYAIAILNWRFPCGCSLFALSVFGLVPAGWLNSADKSALHIAPVKPVHDRYFGTTITDPCRYMENLKDSAVQNWMKAQNGYTRSMLASIPGRHQLLARLK